MPNMHAHMHAHGSSFREDCRAEKTTTELSPSKLVAVKNSRRPRAAELHKSARSAVEHSAVEPRVPERLFCPRKHISNLLHIILKHSHATSRGANGQRSPYVSPP